MNQIIMILLISVLVLVHEIGHFVAAGMCGVRVSRFGIGMPVGPSWKMFTWHNTDFYIHAFLFGGYVSFPDDELSENEDSKNKEAKEDIPEHELYENKTISQKLFIVSAGVIMNIVFAIFLVIFCASVFHRLPASSQEIFVNDFAPDVTSNIKNFDIKKGDQFKKINNLDIKSFYQLSFMLKNSKLFDDYADENLIQKNKQNLIKLNPKIKEEIKAGERITLPHPIAESPLSVSQNVLTGLEKYKKEGRALSKKEISLRDEIYGKEVFIAQSDITLDELSKALSDTYKPLSLTLLRGDREYTIDGIVLSKEGTLGILLSIQDIYVDTKTPKDIITKSIDYLYTTTSTMLYSLWQLITGKINASDMHGVIAIVKVGGDIIGAKGILDGLLLSAMISINLAIMNFLPIPALDGGHVMFLMIEKITGKKPTREFAEKINNFFFFLLIALMVAICYNDIYALIIKKF